MKIKIVGSIFGFENISEVQFEKIDDFFSKVESGDVAFTLIDPAKLRDYSFDIPVFYKELLKLETVEDAAVYNIVIISSEIEKSKINFAAPIVINKKENLLVQIALDETKYKDFGLAEPILDYL